MCAQNLTSSLRYHGEDKHRDEVRYLSSRLLSMLGVRDRICREPLTRWNGDHLSSDK
jgi:hypothetical protein